MNKLVKITTRDVGQKFGCAAVVRTTNGRKLYETRTYPYGHDANAYSDAQTWVEARGYAVAPHANDAQGWDDLRTRLGHPGY